MFDTRSPPGARKRAPPFNGKRAPRKHNFRAAGAAGLFPEHQGGSPFGEAGAGGLSGGPTTRFPRMRAILQFQWDESVGGYKVISLGQELTCRPNPNRPDPVTGQLVPPEQLPKHRYPSTASPSYYILPPAIRTEDDVIYRPNLPSFEDDKEQGQVLGQRDSELLISFLTVPYIRLPLVLTFFASDDRVHKLQSQKLRDLLDSLLFEPGKYLSVDMTGVEPVMVPSQHTNLLATPFGLLLNELHRSPSNVLQAVIRLLEGAFGLDTGSVCDPGEEVTDFNSSTNIILYAVRLGLYPQHHHALADLVDVQVAESTIT